MGSTSCRPLWTGFWGTIWAGPTQRPDTAADAKAVEQNVKRSQVQERGSRSLGHGLVGEGTLVLSEAGARVDLRKNRPSSSPLG